MVFGPTNIMLSQGIGFGFASKVPGTQKTLWVKSKSRPKPVVPIFESPKNLLVKGKINQTRWSQVGWNLFDPGPQRSHLFARRGQ